MQSTIVGKLLKILTIVSEAKKPYTFSELVIASELNKSTLHRILALSIKNGLLQFDEQRKLYLLGPKLFNLVQNAYSGYDIQFIALDEMIRLNNLTGENVTIGVPLGSDVVYLKVLESLHSAGPVQQPGMRESAHCSASGKALLAFLPDSAIKARLKTHDFKQYTARTITEPAAFLKVIDKVRVAGYATNDREEYDHFVGISAPIFNYLSEPIAVLNIWSLHQRCPLEKLCQSANELMISTARVTGFIGGSPPFLGSLTEQNN
ncbi:IclR family transcriptional regulator [Granulosicoccus antarcticus]|uniref:Transcriptional regulator KdgR n=1 Tax=Granulosicoccus antarcticus IMCC3135 TaxID=1192854 RepID=A0A2Z2NUP4_9GAMM|nr:IclR family transcriptional regulator [Granulosicoccus antarcticus]ASJ73741.1 Transcriptional regulator KdgR [Granulosicoccus antarcticus IMCC3135]